jgi:hypothetical protein
MPATVLPAVTFDKAKTLVGRKSVIQIKLGETPHVFLVDYLGDGGAIEMGSMDGIGSGDNPAYVARTWAKKRTEQWKFRTKEIKKVIATFGSLTFHKDATATMFVRDPADAANKVALLSESDFVCSVYRDPAEIAMNSDGSEITIVIQSLKDGAVTITPDGDTSAPA